MPVDKIYFSIYPPHISARRSLLAREFVGFLGRLVGHDRIHELTVWEEESPLRPSMRRLPTEVSLGEIETHIREHGGYYPGGEIRRLHAAVNFLPSKHFVILAGLSGTGKTQIARLYAHAVHGLALDENDPLLFMCPVRPEWTDPTGLTGYYDVLSNKYEVPSFLEAMLVATAHRDSPVFVILDEMNLARVEYYLSDILSAMESRHPIHLHSSGVPIEGTTGTSIPADLTLPNNLFLISTINVDESTHPISDKVLDRAHVIDMPNIDLAGFLSSIEQRSPELGRAVDSCSDLLIAVHAKLTEHSLGFGYRVAEEFVRYLKFSTEVLGSDTGEVIDELMLQKVIVKLRGTERERSLLEFLLDQLQGYPRTSDLLRQLQLDLNEYGSFQAAR